MVDAMTVGEIKELANNYLDVKKMIWFVAGDAETQLPRLKELGFGDAILIY